MTSIVLVTGGSRGIGAATSTYLAKQNYAVCVNYISNKAEAAKVVSDIKKDGGTAIAVQADVSKEADVVRLFDTIDKSLGHYRIILDISQLKVGYSIANVSGSK